MVKYTDNGTCIYNPSSENESGYSLIYQSIITDDGEYIEENYGFRYKECESEYDYDTNTGSSTSTTGIELEDEYRITQTAKTDWFGRKTSDSIKTYDIRNEVVDDENNVVTPAQAIGRIETEYSYPVASDGKTTTRLEKLVNKAYNDNNNTIYDGYAYEYDKQNRIIAEKTLTSSGSKTEKHSYEYDKLGQLVRFNDAITNKSYTYSYDSNGNMLSKKEYNYTTGQLGNATDTINYTYGNSWKDQLSAYDGEQIRYDDIGNPIIYRGATLTWQARELVTYKKDSDVITYEYDENGLRYKKTKKNTEDGTEITENYIWDNGKIISLVLTDANGESLTCKYLYNQSDEPIGYLMFEANGDFFAECYYLRNAQGDITAIVDSKGEVIVRYYYDAFGNRSTDYGTSDLFQLIVKISCSSCNVFGYRGYCYDADTGLYYLQSRYYDPETGRFINADDTSYLNATGTVLGCNLFAYCENDPVNNIDPEGTISINSVLSISSVVSSVLSVLGTFALIAFKQTPWMKFISWAIAAVAIVSNVGSYISALKSAKKFYGEKSKNYKNLIKYNTALLIANVAAVIIGEVLSIKYVVKYSTTIAFTLLNIRTFTIIGLSFSAAELFTNKSMYYRNRVK